MFDNKPYLIAEAGVNHENNLETAFAMIDAAKAAGADAVKFQSYKAEKLASKKSPAYWDTTKEKTQSQYDLFKRHDKFGFKEYEKLALHCRKTGIDFSSTPFDEGFVDFLSDFVSFFKIASADIDNELLFNAIAKYGKPVVLSTGACTISEVWKAIERLSELGIKDITVMHCVLSYPTDFSDANLSVIKTFKDIFPGYRIGYSDHTLPDQNMIVLTSAYLLGAAVIEKHFTMDKTLPGNDHYHAMDPSDIVTFKSNIELIHKILGNRQKKILESEQASRMQARRSIHTNCNIKKGKEFSYENLTLKRPGTGLPVDFLERIIGNRSSQDIAEDTMLNLGMINFLGPR